MTTRLSSKIILVTGGTSGIGRAVAERVASEGAAVVIAGRRAEIGEAIAAGIGSRALFVAVDVTVEADVARLVGTIVERFGRLDGAFNNAGGVNTSGPVHEVDVDGWHAELEQNLTSVFYGLRHQVPAMLASGGGSIVNNASIGAVAGIPGMAPYVAAKHAVLGLTRSVALECAGLGVRVNALVTGNVDTPLYRRLVGAPLEGDLGVAPNPSGRVATPQEIASFVAYLFSDEASFVTGASLAIDGGATAS